jgi:hypothetical protein
MKLSDWKQAIELIASVASGPDPDLAVVAQHDQLWIGPTEFNDDALLTDDLKARLDALGFHWDDEYETWVVFT